MITNLVENTEGAAGCAFAHGLSFYIETASHKLLLDLGPSEAALRNAEQLGIDLASVDTVILSHGHYDHSGGIMPFAGINPEAVIYMQQSAGGEYYADDGVSANSGGSGAAGERYRYIGIDRKILNLPQTRLLRGDYSIDDELELLTIKKRTHALPSTNRSLMIRTGGRYVRDDFRHEQFLVITENGRKVLMSGCAHNGILSILDAYTQKYGAAPDVVISGFHLMKKSAYTDSELQEIREIAEELKQYPTRFITCHCTSLPAYQLMKDIMGDRLGYVHSGEVVDV